MTNRPDLHTEKHDNWDQGGYCNALVTDYDGCGTSCGYREGSNMTTTDYLVEQLIKKDKIIESLSRHQLLDKHQGWIEGWNALSREFERQKKDPAYPIGRDVKNPYPLV
jgi:hypothetical protein